MIDILIPVLGRPHNAAPLVQNIHDTTTTEHRIVFFCSRGDTQQIEACRTSGAETAVMEYAAGHGDYARKINTGYQITDNEWVFNGADDIRFEPGWDTTALRLAGTDRYDVIATNDLQNSQVKRGEFGTHCLTRRRYITDTGGTVDGGPRSFMHEGYDHNYVDRELCHTAQARHRFAFARHSRVRHYHPLWHNAQFDATYRKALARTREDQALFYSRAHLWNHVGLSAHERKLAA